MEAIIVVLVIFAIICLGFVFMRVQRWYTNFRQQDIALKASDQYLADAETIGQAQGKPVGLGEVEVKLRYAYLQRQNDTGKYLMEATTVSLRLIDELCHSGVKIGLIANPTMQYEISMYGNMVVVGDVCYKSLVTHENVPDMYWATTYVRNQPQEIGLLIGIGAGQDCQIIRNGNFWIILPESADAFVFGGTSKNIRGNEIELELKELRDFMIDQNKRHIHVFYFRCGDDDELEDCKLPDFYNDKVFVYECEEMFEAVDAIEYVQERLALEAKDAVVKQRDSTIRVNNRLAKQKALIKKLQAEKRKLMMKKGIKKNPKASDARMPGEVTSDISSASDISESDPEEKTWV